MTTSLGPDPVAFLELDWLQVAANWAGFVCEHKCKASREAKFRRFVVARNDPIGRETGHWPSNLALVGRNVTNGKFTLGSTECSYDVSQTVSSTVLTEIKH